MYKSLCSRHKPWGILGSQGRNVQSRLFYISRDYKRQVEKFTVTSGSSGSITIDLYNSPALSSPTSPVVIYLPPTGSHLQLTHPPIPSYLFSASAALLSINYRWHLPPSSSSDKDTSTNSSLSSHPHSHPRSHPFPIPLHDTLHAYQFLLSTLLPRFSPAPANEHSEQKRNSAYAPPQHHPPHLQRPILIYGSFLSGGLAASLALTESFASKSLPTRIAGLITRNAVFDWTEVVTSPPPEATILSPSAPSQNSSTETTHVAQEDDAVSGGEEWQTQSWTAATLHALKTQLFPYPASGFDPFVSPTQFLKTGGLAIPSSWPDSSASPTKSPPRTPTSKSKARSKVELRSPAFEHDLELDPSAHLEEPEAEAASRDAGPRLSDLQLDPPSRPAHLKFPPATSGLKIPPALFIFTAPPRPSPTSSPSISGCTSSSPAARAEPHKAAKTLKKRPSRTRSSKPQPPSTRSGPQTQAENLATLLRRSIFTHEFSSRKIWDEDLDAGAASEARVRVLGVAERVQERGHDKEAEGGEGKGRVGQYGEGGEKGEEEQAVREWIEDILN